jgi:hypothetical protein
MPHALPIEEKSLGHDHTDIGTAERFGQSGEIRARRTMRANDVEAPAIIGRRCWGSCLSGTMPNLWPVGLLAGRGGKP